MILNKRFFITTLSIAMAMCFVFDVNAAPARSSGRGAAVARKTAVSTTQTSAKVETVSEPAVTETQEDEEEMEIINKSSQFASGLSEQISSSSSYDDNSLAEQIRKQRAAFDARESADAVASAQSGALINGSNACDTALRRCMMETCGDDFTKCALDGDTIFGDKINKCRRDTNCTAHEITLFTAEIKADRDLNVRMQSYNKVIDCGNEYNSCIANECGATYGKCLGKAAADRAIQKCATIAKNCTESDSGLASRFGTVIGKLRENAEIEIKADEERMYKLRDLMRDQCTGLGATFDERSFDCVYTVNFFAGSNQDFPMASRKRYAGDTFVCMQEWFGINATTFKENAYRETRAQKAASSAMLGSGVGTAVGAITSGAINRAIDTKKAKDALNEERVSQGMDTIEHEEKGKKDAVKKQKELERQQDKEKAQQEKEAERAKKEAAKKQKEKNCTDNGGTKYLAGVCYCPTGELWNKQENKCKKLGKDKPTTTTGQTTTSVSTPAPKPAPRTPDNHPGAQ